MTFQCLFTVLCWRPTKHAPPEPPSRGYQREAAAPSLGKGAHSGRAEEGKLGARRGAAEMLALGPLVQRNGAK